MDSERDSDSEFVDSLLDTEMMTRSKFRCILPKRRDRLDMSVESHRLTTFDEWSKQIAQSPKELALAGFFYVGMFL